MATHSCGSVWSGDRACHCARCHVTFSGLTYFDAHRTHDTCTSPQDMGLDEVRLDVWGKKMTEEQRAAFLEKVGAG